MHSVLDEYGSKPFLKHHTASAYDNGFIRSRHRLHICRDLCSFYSLSDPNISVEFYNIDNTFFTYESLLVLKNRLCVITYLDKLLNARNAIITQDAFQTERYYGAVNYLLRGRKPIIETSDFIPLYRRNFFSDFLKYLSPQGLILIFFHHYISP